MGVLTWILFGLIVGLLAKYIVPGSDPGGVIGTVIVGILGAVTASHLAGVFGFMIPTADFSVLGVLFATGGAVVLLFLWRNIIAPLLTH